MQAGGHAIGCASDWVCTRAGGCAHKQVGACASRCVRARAGVCTHEWVGERVGKKWAGGRAGQRVRTWVGEGVGG